MRRRGRRTARVWPTSMPQSQLRVVDVETLKGRQAHERLIEPGRPSWSPDGRAVVMSALHPYSTRFREGTNQVLSGAGRARTRRPTGRDASRPDRWFDPLPHKSIGMRENFGPVWSPDGSADGRDHRRLSAHASRWRRDGAPAGAPRRVSTDLASSPSWTARFAARAVQALDRFRLVDLADGSVRDIVPRMTWTPPEDDRDDGRARGPRCSTGAATTGARERRHRHRGQSHRAGGAASRRAPSRAPSSTPRRRRCCRGSSKATRTCRRGTARSSGASGCRSGSRRCATRPPIRSKATRIGKRSTAGVRIGPRVFTTGEPLDGTRIYYPGGVALDGGALVDELHRAARRPRISTSSRPTSGCRTCCRSGSSRRASGRACR